MRWERLAATFAHHNHNLALAGAVLAKPPVAPVLALAGWLHITPKVAAVNFRAFAFAAAAAAEHGRIAAISTVDAAAAATNQLILAFLPRIRLGIHCIWIEGSDASLAPTAFVPGICIKDLAYIVSNGRGDAIVTACRCELCWHRGSLPMRPEYNRRGREYWSPFDDFPAKKICLPGTLEKKVDD
jgi:hypothetical protein